MASGISGTAIVVGQSDELETGSAHHVSFLPPQRGNNSRWNTDAVVSLNSCFFSVRVTVASFAPDDWNTESVQFAGGFQPVFTRRTGITERLFAL